MAGFVDSRFMAPSVVEANWSVETSRNNIGSEQFSAEMTVFVESQAGEFIEEAEPRPSGQGNAHIISLSPNA